MYAAATEFAAEKASIAYVQRKCRCSFSNAERMLERMVSEGIIETYSGRKAANQPTAPSTTLPAERSLFKEQFRHLDLEEMPDAWGRPVFKHSHVDAIWNGWRQRAAIALLDTCTRSYSTAQATPAAPFNTETQEQIAAVMLQHGTEDQQRAALAYASAAPTTQAESMPAQCSYSIDADPQGIRAMVADAITGALAFGAQGANPPPVGHWLAPFWNAARADHTQRGSALEDAARYRHLHDCNSGSLAVMQITGTGEDDWHILTEDAADAAIDAARKQGGV